MHNRSYPRVVRQGLSHGQCEIYCGNSSANFEKLARNFRHARIQAFRLASFLKNLELILLQIEYIFTSLLNRNTSYSQLQELHFETQPKREEKTQRTSPLWLSTKRIICVMV